MPCVTVITATYNRSHILSDAIYSVLKQDFRDFHYFIVDDGSTDNTKEIIRTFSDPRLKSFFLKHQGQAKALNWAMKKSRTSFVCFLDSDDELLPNHISHCLSKMKRNPTLDFVLAKFELVLKHPHKKYFVNDYYHPGRKIPLEKVRFATGMIFGKRKKILQAGGFPNTPFLDIELCQTMIQKGYTWTRLRKATYRYRFDACK